MIHTDRLRRNGLAVVVCKIARRFASEVFLALDMHNAERARAEWADRTMRRREFLRSSGAAAASAVTAAYLRLARAQSRQETLLVYRPRFLGHRIEAYAA